MFIVLFEDTAALIGVMIALAGIAASQALGRPELDRAASIGIGLLLGIVALFLARESKGLLIERANGLFTVHLGPDQVFAAMTADFMDTLSTADVEEAVVAIEDRLTIPRSCSC
jgi:hypothetical protein